MQENRSFDHYFGHFNKYAGRTDVTSAPENASNPDRVGPVSSGTHPWHRAPHYCFLDTNHGWRGSHIQFDEGKMDGFYETNHDLKGEVMPNPEEALRDGERAMTWYDEKEIPYYYALAKTFGLGDHYFASLLGPTWPNRMYLFAATSFGFSENRAFPDLAAYPFPQNDAVILDELDKRHVDWKLYSAGIAGAAVVLGAQLPLRYSRDVLFNIDEFFKDAAEGKLPPVVYLDPDFTKTGAPDGNDEHPPANLQVGQRYTSRIVEALMKSPQWGKLALFITYDEHGGIYDHLPPPKACVPDDKLPSDKNGTPVDFAFDRYGVRVPFLVVSPYAKRGYVSHGVYDHSSIVRFIQAKHRLPALTARDANALAPMDFFDFQSPPNLEIPQLPEAVVEPGEMSYCDQTFAK
jgi:phospholipase C